jgi:hypothetical protein
LALINAHSLIAFDNLSEVAARNRENAPPFDFRRDYRALRYAVHKLPEKIQQALFALTKHYHLLYAAIDLLYTLEKEYVFLELNPVGQLGWLEQPTGLPLFRTLALLLTGRTEERF